MHCLDTLSPIAGDVPIMGCEYSTSCFSLGVWYDRATDRSDPHDTKEQTSCRDMLLNEPSQPSAVQSARRCAAAQKSNAVLADMKAERKSIQWEHTYVAGDKTFCIYLADSEALIHEHAQRGGFPATHVTEVRRMIDPVTAEG